MIDPARVESAVRPIVNAVARTSPPGQHDDLYDIGVSVAVETWAAQPEATTSYVRSAVMWRIGDTLRHDRRTVPQPTDAFNGTVPDHAPRVVDRVFCRELLLDLPAAWRSVLVASFYLDLPDRATGLLLGLTEGAVKALRFRAMSRLREAM